MKFLFCLFTLFAMTGCIDQETYTKSLCEELPKKDQDLKDLLGKQLVLSGDMSDDRKEQRFFVTSAGGNKYALTQLRDLSLEMADALDLVTAQYSNLYGKEEMEKLIARIVSEFLPEPVSDRELYKKFNLSRYASMAEIIKVLKVEFPEKERQQIIDAFNKKSEFATCWSGSTLIAESHPEGKEDQWTSQAVVTLGNQVYLMPFIVYDSAGLAKFIPSYLGSGVIDNSSLTAQELLSYFSPLNISNILKLSIVE